MTDDMYSSHVRFVAVAFLDAESLQPGPKEVTDLMTRFGEPLFLPSTALEQAPGGVVSNRMIFQSQDSKWRIAFLSRGFEVSLLSADPFEEHLGDFGAFCARSAILLNHVLEVFQRKPQRLAAIQDGFLRQRSEEDLNRVASLLFHYPESYKTKPPFEWDWRLVRREEKTFGSELRESMNFITSLKRQRAAVSKIGPGGLTKRDIDHIRMELDTNTAQDNAASRFGTPDVEAFYGEALSWHNQLIHELSQLLK
jgi:hypothetical protein